MTAEQLREVEENNAPSECLACGRNTAAGTRLFASRKRGKDKVSGETGWLCYPCQEGSARPGADQSMPLSGRYVVIEIGSMRGG